MPIQQTIEIPVHPKNGSLRLTIDVPREAPAGPGILTFTPAPASAAPAVGPFADLGAYLKANTPASIKEAKKEAAKKLADPDRKPFSRHCGATGYTLSKKCNFQNFGLRPTARGYSGIPS